MHNAEIPFLGLFYVIEGFLDILLPPEEVDQTSRTRPNPQSNPPASPAKNPTGSKSSFHSQKPLFNVKSGGIAGYLCR